MARRLRCGYCKSSNIGWVDENNNAVCIDCCIKHKVGPYQAREAVTLPRYMVTQDKRRRRF